MMYSPGRILNALNRRRSDLLRSAIYKPATGSGAAAGLRNAVLFEAFDGKVIGDSPLDIFNALKVARPDLEFFWTVKRTGKFGQVAPEGSTAVKYGSREWLELLATAKYLVNNSAFPWYFKKVSGQVYLQTWHGTPLKRLVRDIEAGKVSAQYLNTMRKEAEAWDYLVSPSAYATETFKSAFGFPVAKTSGKILEVGYPRNDRLSASAAERAATRDRVRKQLGVESAQTQLVLYAPTWRDNSRTAAGTIQAVNHIDQDTKLPDGFRLAFRGHSMTHAHHRSHHAGDAIDVTHYPDIVELYLAADVLVTDYSSVMFDFAVTGKPIIFLTPDIGDYVSHRGFYFDFLGEAPGPVCLTTAEVMRSLETINDVAKQYGKAYKAWQAKFTPLEDGKAAARVVAAVFR
jgi:CDP-glycerol glycerophosphotransferase